MRAWNVFTVRINFGTPLLDVSVSTVPLGMNKNDESESCVSCMCHVLFVCILHVIFMSR